MKTINLFFDFEFTSLSPDAQPISLGIVSDEYFPKFGMLKQTHGEGSLREKSFYAEFSDFDIDRCDDWVKAYVVPKLILQQAYNEMTTDFPDSIMRTARSLGEHSHKEFCSNTANIKKEFLEWLQQFSEYNIQFVGDCATFDWYWMLQLIGEWEKKEYGKANMMGYFPSCKVGLPILPSNISPIPQDLNDLIAYKKEISICEAFGLDRFKDFENDWDFVDQANKHNSLWDAKVIKKIFNKLK